MLKLDGTNLNLGCGSSKFSCCINADLVISHKPDIVLNIKFPLPFKDESFDRIFLSHVIEHIEEHLHYDLLVEIRRILKSSGFVFISYPEFYRCAQNWIDNKWGKRSYWRNTLFGRQAYPTDYHVALMHTDAFTDLLLEVGFKNITWKPEPAMNEHNTMLIAYKGVPQKTYEDVLREELFHGYT